MKNIIFTISLFLFSLVATAQKEINTEFAAKMNQVFQLLEKNRVPHGLLKDQAFEYTELAAYNGVIKDTNFVMPVTIKQIYNTLLTARIHTNASQFIQPDVYEQRWQENRSQGVITLSGLYYNYAQFASNAVSAGKLQVINNQFRDRYVKGSWQNPYETKQVFAIAPSVRTYKGFNFSIKLPSNIWLTNSTQPILNIQIDANDGLGYRTINFNQNLAVSYTTAGMKNWKYKLTLSNGVILYSHSKVYVEEGLRTVPHKDSSNPNQTMSNTTVQNTTDLGKKDITATKSYNGAFGSVKLVIDYASPDRKIRRPLIVAEGFDQGILLSPEEEYGNNDFSDFIDVIDNSFSNELQSLLRNVNTKQYDVIWVDWNNGVDFIQRNAYALQEVIKWVNAEKAANGSTHSNVVMGASMGGLAARYALKDMEDFNIPTQTSLYVSFDSPHQGANFPIGYQYMSRHALHQYVQSPLLLFGGEVITPLFTDGVTPLDSLMLQNTPAARQMLKNYVGINYGINNSFHDNWQNELRLKGYPSMRKIAVSNGNHCAIPQNAPAGANLLSIDGNYSTGWLTDILLTAFPKFNSQIFYSLAILTNEPGFLFGILPGGNKINLDFKVNSLPEYGTNELYKGKITYTKKLLWLININVTITDKSFNSPANTLPLDKYPGGAIEIGVRNSTSSDNGTFWQQALFKYNMTINTEPSFCFVPTASALDIGLGNVPLDNSDYMRKYNVNNPPPKTCPFDNYITSFQNSFILNYDDNFQSTNEGHVQLHLRNANWLAREIDNIPNNNDSFDCSYICATTIQGTDLICNSSSYSVPTGAPFYNWTITQGVNLVTLTGNGTPNVTLTPITNASGSVTLSLTIGDNWAKCGNVTLTKTIWVGVPKFNNLQPVGNQYGYDPSEPNLSYSEGGGCNQIRLRAIFDSPNILEYQWEKITPNVHWGVNSTSNWIIITPQCNQNFTFRVRTRNICGWSDWQQFDYYLNRCTMDCPPPPVSSIVGDNFILSPNPVTEGILNVSVKSDAPWFIIPTIGNNPLDSNNAYIDNGGAIQLISPIIVNISIASQTGVVLLNFPNTLMPATLNLDILPAGTYIVIFEYLGQIESHTIIKQ